MNQPASFTGTTMKSLRDKNNSRKSNRHIRGAFQFLTDLKNAGQVDLDEFGDQKLVKYEISNSSGTSTEIQFKRNGVSVSANIFAQMGQDANGNQKYRIDFKSWDPIDSPLDQPSDGWKFFHNPVQEKPEEAPAVSIRRERELRNPPQFTPENTMNPKWLNAMKEMLYGK
jgi:hypothetical protein